MYISNSGAGLAGLVSAAVNSCLASFIGHTTGEGGLPSRKSARGLRAAIAAAAAATCCAGPVAAEQSAAAEDAGASLFSSKCSGCHTIGRGSLVGPDLKEVHTWKADDVTKAVKRMENFVGPLSGDEVEQIAGFLKDEKAVSRLQAAQELTKAVATADAAPASTETGEALFLGRQRFEKGGTSCIACHQVRGQGGTLARDLTDVYSRMGEAPLLSICENPSFPAMKAIYGEHPLTKQEALHVTKFLSSLKDGDSVARQDPPYGGIGLAAAAAFLAALLFFYRNRNTGVRSRLNRR